MGHGQLLFKKLLLVFILSFISLISLSNGQSDDYPGITVCFNKLTETDIKNIGINFDSYKYLKHQLNYKNCTHIQGSLFISDLAPYENGTDPDLSLLHSIKEISGYLYIRNVSVSKLEFPNLMIIRGQDLTTVNNFGNLSLAVVENKYMNLHGEKLKSVLQTLSMPKLYSIGRGNVLGMNNSGLCFFPHNIQWEYIFEKVGESKVFNPQNDFRGHDWCKYGDEQQNNKINGKQFQCHPDCNALPNGKPGCFSDKSTDCQTSTKCKERRCSDNRCVVIGRNEECCNGLCAAGCTGSQPDQCFACKSFLDGDKCVNSCPSRYTYQDNRQKPNPDFKPKLGPYCVRQCPPSFSIEESSCVIECSAEKPLTKNGTCFACTSGAECPKKCDLYEIMTRLNVNYMTLDSRILKELDKCTHLRGDLFVNVETFEENNVHGAVAVKSVDEFNSLSSLREISGRLQIMSDYKKDFFKNLIFLRNLEKIAGENYAIAGLKQPIVIGGSNLEFIGLQKLKAVGWTSNAAHFINLLNLCYLPETYMKQNLLLKIGKRNVKANTTCINEGKVCHKSCEESLGCWGPGNDLCVSCRTYTVDGKCADNCSDIPGYFFNSKIQSCDKCHEECSETCSGKNNTECIGKCKNAKENGACVKECSLKKYLNSTSGECLPCNSMCATTNIQGRVCDGPGDYPGLGGCNRCLHIELTGRQDKKFGRCQNSTCSRGLHQDFELETEESLKYVTSTGQKFFACRPCPSLCPVCSGKDLTRKTCDICLGFWHQDKCQSACSLEKNYVENNTKECLPCHPECKKGCFGSSEFECNSCTNFRIYLNESKTSFYCNGTCPVDLPYDVREKDVFICISALEKSRRDLREKTLVASLSALGVLLFIILITCTICIYCCRKKAEEEKILEQMKNAMSDKDAPDFKSMAETNNGFEPDMGRLIMVKFDDVEFEDKSRPLGSGAFGKVYKGYWFVPKEETAKLLKEKRRVWLPVAIKEVDISNNGNLVDNTNSQIDEILSEIRVMASVEHKHCLRLFGFCHCQGRCYLLSAFREHGSMDHYLKQKASQLSSYSLLLWASQIADGMAYLEMRGIIHRDLATRNVLIVDDNMVQITDFGLAKMMSGRDESEIVVRHGRVPIRWLSIETLREGRYSHATDVWSYGVTLWEIFTFGKRPYEDVETVDIKDHIEKGGRLSQPEICTLDVYMVMVKCWMEESVARPTFKELLKTFQAFSQNPGRYLFIENDPLKLSPKDNGAIEMCERPLLADNNYQRGMSQILPPNDSPRDDNNRREDDGYLVPSHTGYSDEGVASNLIDAEPLLPKKHETSHSRMPHLGFGGGGNNSNNNTSRNPIPSTLLTTTDGPMNLQHPPRPPQQKFVPLTQPPSARQQFPTSNNSSPHDPMRYCEDPTALKTRAPPPPLPPSQQQTSKLFNEIANEYIPSELGVAPTPFLPHSSTSEDEGYLEAVTTSIDPSTTGQANNYNNMHSTNDRQRTRLPTGSASTMKYADLESLGDEGYQLPSPNSILTPRGAPVKNSNNMYFNNKDDDDDYLQASEPLISSEHHQQQQPDDSFYVEAHPYPPPLPPTSVVPSSANANYINPYV